MVEGVVLKGYSGHYYVQEGDNLWECSLRGRFRMTKQTFLPGDKVKITCLQAGKGVIEEVLPRHNQLLRPPIANVEQALLVFAVHQPEPNWSLLDRMLIQVEASGMAPLMCFNKGDKMLPEDQEAIRYYAAIYPLVITSAKKGEGIEQLETLLRDKITVLAGPSGVGKSSLLNALQPGLALKTGEVSEKIHRGRHTTRHVELMPLKVGGLVADTPGFSSLDLPSMQREELASYFPEFNEFEGKCKFAGCLHIQEPQCAVIDAVKAGVVFPRRYENYLAFMTEIKANERRY